MRYLIPAVALLGLSCLALTPVPVIWGLLVAVSCLCFIAGVWVMRWLDAVLLSVLRRHAEARRRRRDMNLGAGIARSTNANAA